MNKGEINLEVAKDLNRNHKTKQKCQNFDKSRTQKVNLTVLEKYNIKQENIKQERKIDLVACK